MTKLESFSVRSADTGAGSKETKVSKGDTRLTSGGRFKTWSKGSQEDSGRHVSTAA